MEVNIEQLVSKKGTPTLKVNGLYLHSRYDVDLEAEKFVRENLKINRIHILFGNGLGYITEKFLESFSGNEKLIVIEPILEIKNKLSNNKLEYININGLSEEEIEKKLRNLIPADKSVHFCCSPNYDKVCPQSFKFVLKMIKKYISLQFVDSNTINRMSNEWQRNYYYNLIHTCNGKTIEKFKNCTTLPIVIASGGPSLIKQIEHIKAYRKKMILIAAGSTINSLLAYDIDPDIVVSIDSQEVNYNHFKDSKFKKTKLFFGMTNHYMIPNSFDESYCFLGYTNMEYQKHFENLMGFNIPIIYAGGSVANFALAIAGYMTTGPIALIGQDLAYTDNKTHARANKHYKELSEDELMNPKYVLTEGYYGEEVTTDYTFLAMKQNFENIIDFVVKNKVYNCTEGGVKIRGASQVDFSDFCATNLLDDADIRENKYQFTRTEIEDIIAKLNREIQYLNNIKKYAQDNLNLLRKAKVSETLSGSIIKKMGSNDNNIEKYSSYCALETILGPMNITLNKSFAGSVNETENEKFDRIIKKNEFMYKYYIEAVDTVFIYINKTIQQFRGEING